MKKIIHINQHTIKRNSKTGTRDPVITVKTYKSNRYYNALDIVHDGKIVAQIVYSPDKPLKCGAKVWISTDCEIKESVNISEVCRIDG